jgi:hypothetical protein
LGWRFIDVFWVDPKEQLSVASDPAHAAATFTRGQLKNIIYSAIED